MEKASQSFLCVVVSVLLVFGLMPAVAYADSDVVNSDASTQEQLDNAAGSLDEKEATVPDLGNNTTETDGSNAPSDSLIDDNVSSAKDNTEDVADIENDSLTQEPTADEQDNAIAALAAESVDVLPNGDYVIVSALNGNKVLDVTGGSRNNGAQVQLYAFNNTNAQKWRVSHDEKGYVVITNLGSGKVLDIAGAREANGTKIQQYQSNNTLAQKWIAKKTSDGKIQLVSALDGTMTLDIAGAKTNNGTKVQLYKGNNSNAQKFVFKSLNPYVAPCDQVIANGYYTVSSKINGSYVWDISGASLGNGGNAQIYTNNGTNAQIFHFTYVNGYYRIQAASGRVLDVSGASIMNGANIQQYQSNGTNAQLWSAKKSSDGSFTFINKANGLAIDIAGGRAEKSRNLQCYESNGTNAQKFSLTKRVNLINNGTYVIQSGLNTSRVLDVASASLNNGANVQLYTSNNSQAQKWTIQLVSSQENTYTIRSVVSGKMLTMDANGNVCQRNETADQSQYWRASISAGRTVFTNMKYNKVLDVAGAKTSNGTNVQGYASNGTAAQRFNLVGTNLLSNGVYFIKSAQNGNQVLDVKSGSRNNGANVQSYANNNSGAQKWRITQNGDGSYTIINAQSGKALDVKSAQKVSGTNIQQYTSNKTAAQKWFLITNNDSTFKLASALDRTLVVTFTATPNSGVNVVVAKDTNSANQKVRFSATTYNPIPLDRQAMQNRINGYSSGSQWLIAVDRSTHKVGVFKGAAGRWSLQNYWSCVTGAPSSPTITGVFRTTGYKRPVLSTDSRARYCTQIKGGYFFHTTLASDNELGQSLSHGCIRMSPVTAQWIYNSIGAGTTVVIYN